MNLLHGDYTFNSINVVNVILGKNGSGKSTALKHILGAKDEDDNEILIEYITPERGGILKYEAGIDQNVGDNPNWVHDTRKKNQLGNFKQQTISRYQALELKILRAIADEKRGDLNFSFTRYVDKINSLLDNIEIRPDRNERGFKIYKKGADDLIESEQISSGESELIALAIECLHFQQFDASGKIKILLLDEPDVHLHPDLQIKFMNFIYSLATEEGLTFKVIIATHSTALLSAISHTTHLNIGFISPGEKVVQFKPVTAIYQKFLPVFGAHPLSTVFNESPILLVEGEDDERIWQQAKRSSTGQIKLYPCVCGDVDQISVFETEIKSVLNSIYDNPKAYSLRDRDMGDEADPADDLPIVKFKLKCYSAENLLLTNEVLDDMGFTWQQVIDKMNEWIIEKETKSHPQLEEMISFQASGYNRKTIKVKFLRNLLMGILGFQKPWEVTVGQTIAALRWNDATDYTVEGSIYNYLGEKITRSILIHN